MNETEVIAKLVAVDRLIVQCADAIAQFDAINMSNDIIPGELVDNMSGSVLRLRYAITLVWEAIESELTK